MEHEIMDELRTETEGLEPAAVCRAEERACDGVLMSDLVRQDMEKNRNRMTLYHGSARILDEPFCGYGSPLMDYGPGLYCTENRKHAKEWAVRDGKDGYVNEYELDTTGLEILDLSRKGASVLSWLAVLAENRAFCPRFDIGRDFVKLLKEKFLPDLDEYDVIRGWPGDEVFFYIAEKVIDNTNSFQALVTFLHASEDMKQIVLRSERAFAQLKFREAVSVPAGKYYPIRLKMCLDHAKLYHYLMWHTYDRTAYTINTDIQREDFKDVDIML